MVTYPQTGTYAAQDLPANDRVLFCAWQFLGARQTLQPQAYQGDFTLKILRRLMSLGEKRPPATAAALLLMMPASVSTQIARAVSPDVPAIIQDYAHHARTRFAYIDQASPAAQKIVACFLINALTEFRAKGDAEIMKIAAAEENGTPEGKITISLLPAPRDFQLVADKIQECTGSTRVESALVDAVLEYQAYYEDYLQQLAGYKIVQKSLGDRLQARFEGEPPRPRLDETAIPGSDIAAAVYAQICMDPRVSFDQACTTVRLTEIIADAGETNPVVLAAALLQAAYPVVSPTDEAFLSQLGGGIVAPAVDLLRDNIDFKKTAAPLAYGPQSLRQLELARVIARLRDGQLVLDDLQATLDGPLRGASADARETYAAHALVTLQGAVSDMKNGILTEVDELDCPVLADEAKAQLRLLTHMIDRATSEIGLGILQPRRQKPPGTAF